MSESDYTAEIQAKSDDLRSLIAEDREGKIERRCKTIVALYADFAEMLPRSMRESIWLSEYVLKYALSCYFNSIYEYVGYHPGGERSDSHIQAAYMYYWIIKMRPIQLRFRKGERTIGTNWVNAYFAVHVSFSFILQNEELQGMIDGDIQEVYDALVYQAQCFDMTEKGLTTQFLMLDRLLKQKKDLLELGGRRPHW